MSVFAGHTGPVAYKNISKYLSPAQLWMENYISDPTSMKQHEVIESLNAFAASSNIESETPLRFVQAQSPSLVSNNAASIERGDVHPSGPAAAEEDLGSSRSREPTPTPDKDASMSNDVTSIERGDDRPSSPAAVEEDLTPSTIAQPTPTPNKDAYVTSIERGDDRPSSPAAVEEDLAPSTIAQPAPTSADRSPTPTTQPTPTPGKDTPGSSEPPLSPVPFSIASTADSPSTQNASMMPMGVAPSDLVASTSEQMSRNSTTPAKTAAKGKRGAKGATAPPPSNRVMRRSTRDIPVAATDPVDGAPPARNTRFAKRKLEQDQSVQPSKRRRG
jgi:hypothetical protein